MVRWSVSKVAVWIVAILVTGWLSLSAIPAAPMMPEPARLTMMTGMDMSGHGDHGSKPSGGKTDPGKTMACSPHCAHLVSTAEAAAGLVLMSRLVVFMAFETLPTGRPNAPDPHPPRPANLG